MLGMAALLLRAAAVQGGPFCGPFCLPSPPLPAALLHLPPCPALPCPVQMCVLDGNTYDQKVVEAGEEREDDLEACALLLNNKAQALLQTGPGGTWEGLRRAGLSWAGRESGCAGVRREGLGKGGRKWAVRRNSRPTRSLLLLPRGCFPACLPARPLTPRCCSSACPGAGASHNANSKVQMALTKGVAVLPDLHVSGGCRAVSAPTPPPSACAPSELRRVARPVQLLTACWHGNSLSLHPCPAPSTLRTPASCPPACRLFGGNAVGPQAPLPPAGQGAAPAGAAHQHPPRCVRGLCGGHAPHAHRWQGEHA